MKHSITLVLVLLLISGAAFAQHESHPLGKVNFKNSCDASVQEAFQRSVAMLHSFRYAESEKSFRAVLANDPSCTIAHWGIASILMSNPLSGVGPSTEWAARAKLAVEEGRKAAAKTEREKDYLEAVAKYWEDWANRPEKTRQLNRARAYEALAAKYPDDDEAKIFHALYLSGTQSLADQKYTAYLAAAEILEKQFQKYPDHPGAAHYLIHSYDAPAIAAKGLNAARRYAEIAPAAPHALHMPSHIFTRVGHWKDSIATNIRSAEAAKAAKEFEEQLHAMDYLTYASLQMGRDADAKRIADEGIAIKGFNILRYVGPYAQAAMAARYALERGDWKSAARLEPIQSSFQYIVALTHFARGVGAARSGDHEAAEREVVKLSSLRDELKSAKNEYWAGEVEIERLGVAAWAALARGKKDEAVELMRMAAQAEDLSEKHIVTPGRLLPARELLGDMLFALGRPMEALKEYEATQLREPGRFRSFFGAAVSAEKARDAEKARLYYTKLVELADGSDQRADLAKARKYLSRATK